MQHHSQSSHSRFCSLWKEGRRYPCRRWGRSRTCSWWRGRWSSLALGAWYGAGGGTDAISHPEGRRFRGGCRSPWRETWCLRFRRRWPARPRARGASGSTSSDLWNPDVKHTKSVSLNQIPSLRFSLFSVEADSSLSYLDSFLCPTVCICKVSTRWQLRSVLGFLTSLSSVSSSSPIFTKLASNSFLLSWK